MLDISSIQCLSLKSHFHYFFESLFWEWGPIRDNTHMHTYKQQHTHIAHLSSRINGVRKRELSSSWLLCRLLCWLLCWLLHGEKEMRGCQSLRHGWLMVHVHFILCYPRKRLMWVISWISDFSSSISYCVNCHEIFAPARKKHWVTNMHGINRLPCINWTISFTNTTFYRDLQDNHSLSVISVLLLGQTIQDPASNLHSNNHNYVATANMCSIWHVGLHSGISPVLYMQVSSDNTRGGYITWAMQEIRLLIIPKRVTGVSMSR